MWSYNTFRFAKTYRMEDVLHLNIRKYLFRVIHRVASIEDHLPDWGRSSSSGRDFFRKMEFGRIPDLPKCTEI